MLMSMSWLASTLSDQGKEWHSLERWQWMDGEIRFRLNPSDQELYRTGWFSIDDLIAWTGELGPIVIERDVRVRRAAKHAESSLPRNRPSEQRPES